MENKKQKIISIILMIIIFIAAYFIFGLNIDKDIIRIDIGELPSDFVLAEESDLQIIYFNVGDADCILVKDDNDVMLIDAGEEADGKYIVEYLKRLGITEINYLIGTHEHEDHIGGMNYVIDSFDIGNIYLPEIKNENLKQYKEIVESADKKGYKVESPQKDNWIVGDSICIVEYIGEKQSNPNNNSIVIRLENNDKRYLFTGDIEKTVEDKIKDKEELKNISILKVAHHGANTSSTDGFLQNIKPEYSIVSAGNNPKIMDEEIIERLKAISKVYITKYDNSIYVTNRDGENNINTLKTKVDSIQH